MEVRIENLVKRFGDVTAVNNVNATFESGKLIALLGPSGCGKTTMLNMLSGIMPVTEGKIYFDGTIYKSMDSLILWLLNSLMKCATVKLKKQERNSVLNAI